MRTRTLEFCMAQDYPVEIRAIPGELGGGYSASIPCLGRWTFYAVGGTQVEALEELESIKRALFEDALSRGDEIPAAPPLEDEETADYSGKLALRLPKELHRRVADRAKANGCSINQYIMSVLAERAGAELCAEQITSERCIDLLSEKLLGSRRGQGSGYAASVPFAVTTPTRDYRWEASYDLQTMVLPKGGGAYGQPSKA